MTQHERILTRPARQPLPAPRRPAPPAGTVWCDDAPASWEADAPALAPGAGLITLMTGIAIGAVGGMGFAMAVTWVLA